MSRWKTSPEGRDHYQCAIRHYLKKDPLKAADVFIEFWKKYLSVFEPQLQLRLSMLLHRSGHTDLASHTLRALIDSPQPPDVAMEQAYLSLAKIYRDDLKRDDAAIFVYRKFLETFPTSRYREFVERMLISLEPLPEGRGFQER